MRRKPVNDHMPLIRNQIGKDRYGETKQIEDKMNTPNKTCSLAELGI